MTILTQSQWLERFSADIEGTVAIGDPVYWNTTNTQWEKAADGTVAPTGIYAGESRVITKGILDGLSGLTPGEWYYLAQAGGITTASTTEIAVGYAESATRLFVTIGTFGGSGGSRVLSKREKVIASTTGQTLFTLVTMSYNTFDDGLLIMRDGKVLNKDEYAKTSSTSVTLVNGAVDNDVLEFVYYYSETGLEAVAWELIDSHTIGDTVMNLSYSYSIGTHQLFVMRNGAMQIIGASYDFTETTTTSITLNTAIVKTDEEILVFKFGAVQDTMNHAMDFHDDWKQIDNTKVWDAPNIANGASALTTLTVTGAVLGDFVMVAASGNLLGLSLTAYVSAADTVTLLLNNNTGGAVDLGSLTYYARVVTRS